MFGLKCFEYSVAKMCIQRKISCLNTFHIDYTRNSSVREPHALTLQFCQAKCNFLSVARLRLIKIYRTRYLNNACFACVRIVLFTSKYYLLATTTNFPTVKDLQMVQNKWMYYRCGGMFRRRKSLRLLLLKERKRRKAKDRKWSIGKENKAASNGCMLSFVEWSKYLKCLKSVSVSRFIDSCLLVCHLSFRLSLLSVVLSHLSFVCKSVSCVSCL